MSALMSNLDFFRVYLINSITIALGSFDDHLAKVGEVMKRLQSAGLKCKIYKYNFSVPKVEYLGCIITQEGIKLDLKPPPNQLSIFKSLRMKNR